MFLATEVCETRTVCAALVEKIRARAELNWFALVDGAFDYKGKALALPHERHHLYAFEGMSDLVEVSPYVVVLSAHDESLLSDELTTLVRHRQERPMLSFIASTASVNQVVENLRVFVKVFTDDKQEFLLRFADTRVLAGLPAALRKENYGGFTDLMAAWLFIDRTGDLVELPLLEERRVLARDFALSTTEFAALVTGSEPDAIIDVIAETNPEALPDKERANLYGQVAGACGFAKKHGVLAFPDIVALAYLAILNPGCGLKNPELSTMLLRGRWEAGRLIDELQDFVK